MSESNKPEEVIVNIPDLASVNAQKLGRLGSDPKNVKIQQSSTFGRFLPGGKSMVDFLNTHLHQRMKMAAEGVLDEMLDMPVDHQTGFSDLRTSPDVRQPIIARDVVGSRVILGGNYRDNINPLYHHLLEDEPVWQAVLLDEDWGKKTPGCMLAGQPISEEDRARFNELLACVTLPPPEHDTQAHRIYPAPKEKKLKKAVPAAKPSSLLKGLMSKINT